MCVYISSIGLCVSSSIFDCYILWFLYDIIQKAVWLYPNNFNISLDLYIIRSVYKLNSWLILHYSVNVYIWHNIYLYIMLWVSDTENNFISFAVFYLIVHYIILWFSKISFLIFTLLLYNEYIKLTLTYTRMKTLNYRFNLHRKMKNCTLKNLDTRNIT